MIGTDMRCLWQALGRHQGLRTLSRLGTRTTLWMCSDSANMEGLRSTIKTELNAEICVTKLKLKVKDYPVLQDIDWNISDILIHNPEGSIEEIVFKITDGVSSVTIKECRTQLFKITLCKLREEISVKENTDIAIRLRNRRGETSNTKKGQRPGKAVQIRQ